MSEKYSTHIIELIRNNGIKQSLHDSEGVYFLMFDYFDLLIYKELKGKDKQYLNYFSLGNVFKDDKDYKVSYKTLSLYCQKNKKVNPFLTRKRNTVTDIPFLGIIQISLCKENFCEENFQQDIDGFLTMCEKEIMRIVENYSDEYMIYQLYRSSTTGDFCLVIRSDAVEKIYNIALTLSDSQNKSKNNIKMLTYTNVGIECRVLKNGCYATLSKKFIETHSDIMFSLRFSADVQFANVMDKYQQQKKRVQLQKIKGLFGRYDYLLHIDLKEFAEIYPVLCEKKLGRQSLGNNSYVEGNIELSNILRYPYIRNINERVLVSLRVSEEENGDPNNEAYYDEIISKNEILYDKILGLKKWNQYYQCEYRAFQDLYRGMIEIYKTFSAIGMEKEAYINWLMFYKDMDVLCTNINQKMKKYETLTGSKEGKKRVYRIRLLKDWRMSIKAINKYTRLVQNINYQTYQSPVYEIQTQIDTAKTMVAYREAMDNYIGNYMEYNSEGNDDGAKIVPIVYPDLSKDKVEVVAPFLSYGNVKNRHILCTVPSFEYFGRLYDLLPWLMHEASHQIRILERQERNEFVTEYILEAVLEDMLDVVLPKFSNNVLYMFQGINEQLLTNSIVQVAKEKIICVEKFDEYGFEEVVYEIKNFLNRLFRPTYIYINKKNRTEQKEILKAILDYLCDEYRREGLATEENLNLIINFEEDELYKDWSGLKSKLENLLYGLLDKYVERLDGKENEDLRVYIEDIYVLHHEFEDKLLQIGKKARDLKIKEEAIKEYCFKLKEMYRIANSFMMLKRLEEDEGDKERKEYVDLVIEKYNEMYKNNIDYEKKCVLDMSAMHFMRDMGILEGQKDIFRAKLLDVLRRTDIKQIEAEEEKYTKLYREVFADLLMVTSLNMNSFGYCRQVLQTISDARVDELEYDYDDVDNERFRIVTAVLLCEELKISLKDLPESEKYILINAKSVIESGIIYCKYTLKCICDKFMEKENIKKDSAKQKLVADLLNNVYAEMRKYFEDMGIDDAYKYTILNAIIRDKEMVIDEVAEKFEKYEEIINEAQEFKYLFWRLECFCLGIEYIFQGSYVKVSKNICLHMYKIREKIKKEKGKGCIWEKETPDLLGVKAEVGNFYNIPKLVYKKTSKEKLESTIEFIQNFYYYNRFRMMHIKDDL